MHTRQPKPRARGMSTAETDPGVGGWGRGVERNVGVSTRPSFSDSVRVWRARNATFTSGTSRASTSTSAHALTCFHRPGTRTTLVAAMRDRTDSPAERVPRRQARAQRDEPQRSRTALVAGPVRAEERSGRLGVSSASRVRPAACVATVRGLGSYVPVSPLNWSAKRVHNKCSCPPPWQP